MILGVFCARNLASVDAMNKSNPFVVVELVNALLQTHTEYKTINPEWNKIFTFAVKDIHSIVEITISDEDPNKKAEFLGKIAIPLLQVIIFLQIQNCEPKWYALKDRKLRTQVKGQILLEMDIVWNPIRAAIRTFTPRERKYMQRDPKFKRRLFINSYTRLREFLLVLVEIRDYVQSCFDWDSPMRSLFAFVVFIIFVYFFHIHHIPIIILLFFLRPYKIKSSKSNKNSSKSVSESEEEPDFIDTNGQSSSSIRERFNTFQDTMAKVQNTMDFVASLLERVQK
uniref:C2 domain-containing protein n=1 Tax=Loa loa TaxID=7209 RepID=A0A1I7VES0_LOALO